MTDRGTRVFRRNISRRSFARGIAGAVMAGVVGHQAAAAHPRTTPGFTVSRQGTTEIEFWHGFAAHEIEALQEMLDKRFAPAHPEIKVNVTGEATAEDTGGNFWWQPARSRLVAVPYRDRHVGAQWRDPAARRAHPVFGAGSGRLYPGRYRAVQAR